MIKCGYGVNMENHTFQNAGVEKVLGIQSLCFTKEDTEAQERNLTCSRSPSKLMAESGVQTPLSPVLIYFIPSHLHVTKVSLV